MYKAVHSVLNQLKTCSKMFHLRVPSFTSFHRVFQEFFDEFDGIISS